MVTDAMFSAAVPVLLRVTVLVALVETGWLPNDSLFVESAAVCALLERPARGRVRNNKDEKIPTRFGRTPVLQKFSLLVLLCLAKLPAGPGGIVHDEFSRRIRPNQD